MPKRIKTGIEFSGQRPILEKVGPHWLLWVSYNFDQTAGTYFRLMGDGQIWRETVSPTGEVSTVVVKPRDKS